MATDQDVTVTLHCPRCKGVMYKPVGSVFYWHADTNHPACSITNIPETPEFTTPAREREVQRTPENEVVPR